MRRRMTELFVGIDTGGTFTDLVLLRAGEMRVHKVLSTPDDPSRAIMQGLVQLGVAVRVGDSSALSRVGFLSTDTSDTSDTTDTTDTSVVSQKSPPLDFFAARATRFLRNGQQPLQHKTAAPAQNGHAGLLPQNLPLRGSSDSVL